MMKDEDDLFAEQLAALDECLAEGTLPLDGAPLAKNPRLHAAFALLQRVEQAWPRTTPALHLPIGFGRFHLKRILGTGGFGIVYLAEDSQLRRSVALKMPRPEMMLTPSLRQRFLREARAAAQLQHPHIVPIFDSGEIGATCFIVSAYCSGGSLAAWLKEQETLLPFKTAAALTGILADAVQHAHQRGILHRDLKPANILLTPAVEKVETWSGFPFSPHVADFGLAKVIHASVGADQDPTLTAASAIMGTPAYMAPEQARGGESAGPTADVYALGSVLYELLTGQPPFRAASNLETLQRVAEQEPVPPSGHRPDVPRDLEAICLKCLEKKPGQRYASAAELAGDLQRYLSGKPTLARPLGLAGRTVKTIRRHPTLVGLLAVLGLATLLVVAGALWRAYELDEYNQELAESALREKDLAEKARQAEARARQAQALAEQRERRLRLQAFANNLSVAEGFWKEGRVVMARDLLHRQVPQPGEDDPRDFAWRYLWHLSRSDLVLPRKPHLSPVSVVAFAANGQRLVSANKAAEVQTHELLNGNLLSSRGFHVRLPAPNHSVFSRKIERIAILSQLERSTLFVVFDSGAVTPLYREEIEPPMPSLAMDFSPDGERIALCGPLMKDGSVISVVNLKNNKKTTVLSRKGYQAKAVAFSPDGSSLAAIFDTPTFVSDVPLCLFAVHHFPSGKQAFEASVFRLATCLVWSPDGKMLAAGGLSHDVALWSTEPLDFRRSLPLLAKSPHGLAFSPDGKHLAVIDARSNPESRKVRTFQVHDGAANPRVFESDTPIGAVAWSPKDNLLAIAGDGDNIRLWNPLAAPADQILPGHQNSEAWAVAFAPDGKTLASGGDDHTVRYWDPWTGYRLGHKEDHSALVSCLAYSPNGRWLASGSYDKEIVVRSVMKPHDVLHRFKHTNHLRCLAFSADSKILASGGRDFMVRLWDPHNGKALGTLPGHTKTVRALAFSARENLLASASDDRTVRLWQPGTQSLVRTLNLGGQVWSVAFSPDGRTLATGDLDGTLTFWNVADGKVLATLYRHAKGIRSLAFSPDGKTLASGGEDKTVRLFNPAIHQELFAFPPLSDEVHSIAWAPDGTFLAAALHDGNIALWHGPLADR